MFYPALKNVGNDVLIIKDNKVVGSGRSHIGRGDSHGIRLNPGPLLDSLVTLEPYLTLGTRDVYVDYMLNTGLFLGFSVSDECAAAEAILEGTRAVDSFAFDYGRVPDTFKDVPGYGECN